MLVIHIISTADTNEFSSIYANLDCTLLINPSRAEAMAAIQEEQDTVVLIGHGDEYGLYDETLSGHLIGHSFVDVLRNKRVIGIWCFAGNYAERNDLHGFFTSNFISNVTELVDVGFSRFDDDVEEISSANRMFSRQINFLLQAEVPVEQWLAELQSEHNIHFGTPMFIRYNYEAMITR